MFSGNVDYLCLVLQDSLDVAINRHGEVIAVLCVVLILKLLVV